MTDDFTPSVDLNLLLVLDTLLQTRNVTRAAERLHLSQPTVSGYLRRLRLYFGDDLLIRDGNRFELTPLAQQLATRTPSALDAALSIFDANATFVPAETRREFTLTMSDYETAIFLPVLLLNDVEGQLFADLALTIACAVTVSMVVAVTVLPSVAARWMLRAWTCWPC